MNEAEKEAFKKQARQLTSLIHQDEFQSTFHRNSVTAIMGHNQAVIRKLHLNQLSHIEEEHVRQIFREIDLIMEMNCG